MSTGALMRRQQAAASSRWYSVGLTQRCRGSPSRCTRPSASRRPQACATKLRPGLTEARIAVANDRGELIEGLVVLERRYRLDLVEPFGELCGCPIRRGARHPEALEIDERAHTLRAHPGIEARDVAAHAVPDEPHRPVAAQNIEERIEVRQIIVKPVAILRPIAAAEAAPVERRQRPVVLESVHQELKRIARILIAVQQQPARLVGDGAGGPSCAGAMSSPRMRSVSCRASRSTR